MDQGHNSFGKIPPSVTEKRETDPRASDDTMTVEDGFADEEAVDLSDMDECPWCGEEYDAVPQHAAQAHPDEYYKDYTEE